MQYLLLIDTSVDTSTVALSGDSKLLTVITNEQTRNHAATLNNMITDVLANVKIVLNELAGIVVCSGPGSYTGLRIGMATAKGICYGLNKPLLLTDRLTLLAYQKWQRVKTYSEYIAILIAREKEYFVCSYDRDFRKITEPVHVSEQQLKLLIEEKQNTAIITDASDVLKDLFIGDNFYIDTDTKIDLPTWCSFAFQEYNCNKIVNLMNAEPLYLKQVYTHK